MLAAADSILIPLQCEYYALEGLSQLLSTIHLLQHGVNPDLAIDGVVLTMYDSRLNLSRQVVADAREYFGQKVFQTIVPRNIRLAEAPSFGKPILLYDVGSAGAQAYISIAKELLERHGRHVPAAIELAPERSAVAASLTDISEESPAATSAAVPSAAVPSAAPPSPEATDPRPEATLETAEPESVAAREPDTTIENQPVTASTADESELETLIVPETVEPVASDLDRLARTASAVNIASDIVPTSESDTPVTEERQIATTAESNADAAAEPDDEERKPQPSPPSSVADGQSSLIHSSPNDEA